MTLKEKKCVACRKGDKALSEEEASQLLRNSELDGWQMLDDASLLIREFHFPDYASAFQLVSNISKIAEEEQHHPDIAFGWGYCTVALQTHAINGLHENDFIMAAKINQLLS